MGVGSRNIKGYTLALCYIYKLASYLINYYYLVYAL